MNATFLSWSSGKDAAWTLQVLRRKEPGEPVGLVTTLDESADAVAFHCVRSELVRAQARAVGLPLEFVYLAPNCSNREYEAAMGAWMMDAQKRGIRRLAYGDLLLKDVRAWRERMLSSHGMESSFPIYGSHTAKLAAAMVAAGLEATVVSVDLQRLPASFAGRRFDSRFLAELPEGVDPCGEFGEFHTFVTDGPMFREPVAVTVDDVLDRGGYAVADLKLIGT